MKVFSIALVAAIAWIGSTLHAAPGAEINKSYKLPVPSVSPEGFGTCQYVEFSLTRRPASKAPLMIAIAEDTPGGAGESVRASVWMAAMVAGLDRLDDLSGTKIAIELPGQVDGPSAGGVICLAIRAALDAKDFPADFTMTGSIMPDGTIGSVGGIAIKMVAAVKSGARRIAIPAYLRFEKDPRSGEEIDLKRLAASLKLELVTVENISQAMRAAYGLDPKPAAADNHAVLDLPEAMEELLKQRY